MHRDTYEEDWPFFLIFGIIALLLIFGLPYALTKEKVQTSEKQKETTYVCVPK